MVQIYPTAILQVLAFNALGQVATFAITKTYFTTFWNMSDEQIKTLHAKYEKDPKLSENLSNVENLLLYFRFEKLGLSTDQVEDEPVTEEIEALTESQVRTLHEYGTHLNDEPEDSVLFLRYFNLNLAPLGASEGVIGGLSLPNLQTVEDVASLTKE